MRAVLPDFVSGEIVVNADGSVRIALAQNAAGDGDACFVAVHFKTLVQHSTARIISITGRWVSWIRSYGFSSVCFCTENGSNKPYSPLDFKYPAVFRRPFFFSFQGRLKASKQPYFKLLLSCYPLSIPLAAFTDPTTGVPDLPARL